MKARPVVVTLEVAQLEREMCDSVGTIANRDDPPFPCQAAESLHREELSCQISNVTEVQDLRAWCNRLLETLIEIVLSGWHWKGNLRERDSITSYSLIPSRPHSTVVLVSRDDFVTGLEVDAILRDLQRLTRIPRDG